MPSPKDGNAASLVTPASPREAMDADEADPGQVTLAKALQAQLGTGKYGAVPVQAYKPSAASDNDPKLSWIEIQMVDEEAKPVTGLRYQIKLPDDSVAEGTLDARGLARVEGIQPGSCQITFPDLDQEAWKPG